eukprot:CAMPEP_0171668450 /NCGR_PEP_ID=MMETSP0990-20121206/49381_1 /TAXON_ID=483369 /ORGANISM="non described non described, Strain CCMP2098" /LENGTH=260 /DNA_ID=CAMNT_0012252511 /DNA_START=89 /DNA_END=872 /DNA_ORIENTATION=+
MPFEDEYLGKGWVSNPEDPFIANPRRAHPVMVEASTEYAHGYPIHFFRKNTVHEPLTNDKLFALKAVKQRGRTLEEMSENLQNDEDVVFEAVKQDGLALRFAAAPMRREKHIVYAACAQNASALEFTQFCNKDLQADKATVMIAVARGGMTLRFASETLRDDDQVVRTAVGQNGRALQYASPRLRGNKKMVIRAVKAPGDALLYCNTALLGDAEVLQAALASSFIDESGDGVYLRALLMRYVNEIVDCPAAYLGIDPTDP